MERRRAIVQFGWLARILGVPLLLVAAFAGKRALCQTGILGGQAPKYVSLYDFQPDPDGAAPVSGLSSDAHSHNIYGTTQAGGTESCYGFTEGCGTVFELIPRQLGEGQWQERIVYEFEGVADGGTPQGSLISDPSGNLYGTTEFGGNTTACIVFGCGVVFELKRSAHGWTEEIIHAFAGADGSQPTSGLIFDNDGNLYGTTAFGGNVNCSSVRGSPGCGVVFELKRNGSGWSEQVLHAFSETDGANPYAGLAMDHEGNLYGTTYDGGNGAGVVFELKPNSETASDGVWSEIILENFLGNISDGTPNAGVTLDDEGNVYGTTDLGGEYGSGSVFELTESAGAWSETLLHSFTGGSDGSYPSGGVSFDREGNLYGTTAGGGHYLSGVTFQLHNSGGSWDETVLHNFQGGTDGEYPMGNLLLYDGAIYGTTELGGDQNCQTNPPNSGCGMVYSISR
jgi:uncharacterized repeat protein (TIGR03803 family)